MRLGPPTSVPAAQTLCIKLPDAYGPGQDQDFLLASSADGAPLHHLTLPAASRGARLYSSLWLYAAGLRPLLFGLLPLPEGASFGPGTVVPFAASGPIGRFRRIGDLRLGDEITDAAALDLTFAARNDGGGLRALPPARFYRSPSRY